MSRLEKIAILSLSFLSLISWVPDGHAYEDDTTFEFDVKRRYQEERIRDFYSRFNEIERMDVERRRGEQEKRLERKQIENEYEKARREFISQRKQKPPLDPSAHEREIRARQAEHERARKDFVKARDRLNDFMSRTVDIPEEDEYDLYFDADEPSETSESEDKPHF